MGDFINNNNPKKPVGANDEQEEKQPNYVFFYIALGCFALGALMFGLAFAVRGAGTYFLFASMISELAAVTFLNAQKKRYPFKWILLVRVFSYAVMAAALVIVIFGLSIVASTK